MSAPKRGGEPCDMFDGVIIGPATARRWGIVPRIPNPIEFVRGPAGDIDQVQHAITHDDGSIDWLTVPEGELSHDKLGT